MFKKCLLVSGVAAALLLLVLFTTSGVARADSLTQTDTIPTMPLVWIDDFEFDQFNPGAGILTGVLITVTSDMSGTIVYTNTSTGLNLIPGSVVGTVDAGFPDGAVIGSENFVEINELLGPSNSRQVDFSGSISEIRSTALPADLLPYIGAGFVSVPVTATASFATAGIANAEIDVSSTGNGAAELRYVFAIPQMTLQKLTNGFDADNPNDVDVPEIAPGQAVTWTYVVTNTGTISVPLDLITVTDSIAGVTPQFVPSSDNGDQLLAPNEAWIYIATGTATDLLDPTATDGLTIVAGCTENGNSPFIQRAVYMNSGFVVVPGSGATDDSHYCNPAEPGIELEKLTNGADADDPQGLDVPELTAGAEVTWRYLVTNTGNVSFTQAQVVVTDSNGGVTPQLDPTSDDGDGVLAPGESWTYIATGTVADLLDPDETAGATVVNGCSEEGSSTFGQRATYENLGTVTVPGDSDDDLSHYCNPAEPGIELEKLTNGADADDPQGLDVPELTAGAEVTWRYLVTNTGNVSFTQAQVVVTDSNGGVTPQLDPTSDDGDGVLAPGESWTYIATGTVADLLDPDETTGATIVNGCSEEGSFIFGQHATYENLGTVTVPGDSDDDLSHYCNPADPGIDIEKFTNGIDADDSNATDVPSINPGNGVVWTYSVLNTGNVTFTLSQVTVTDDIDGVNPTFVAASDDGDGLLAPGESWEYSAADLAVDLLDPDQTANLTIVPGCGIGGSMAIGQRATYTNVGTVTVPGDSDEDPSHYCNLELPPPTALTLVHLTATEGNRVLITWATTAEQATTGFYVYRATAIEPTDPVRITDSLVAALPAQAGITNEYRFVDNAVFGAVPYMYWLVEVESNGNTVIYGPEYVTVPGGPGRVLYMPVLED